MASRNDAFNQDVPETPSDSLRKLGYSEDEIGATVHSLPDTMVAEDKLRTSLRALSAEKSHTVQAEAETRVAAKPKNVGNARIPNENEDYWQGRRDEAAVSKENRTPKSSTGRAPRQVDPAAKALKQAKQAQRLARMLKGKRR